MTNETPMIDYSNTSVATLAQQEHRGVVIPEAVVITAGEYQSEGEPDLVITVNASGGPPRNPVLLFW